MKHRLLFAWLHMLRFLGYRNRADMIELRYMLAQLPRFYVSLQAATTEFSRSMLRFQRRLNGLQAAFAKAALARTERQGSTLWDVWRWRD